MLPLRVLALGVALSTAGCASDEEYRREVYGHPQAQVAMRAGAAPAVKKSEVEDDGLPSQVAPPMNRRREADDPSEPFSPNYGKGGTPGAPQPPTQPAQPANAPTKNSQPARQAVVAPGQQAETGLRGPSTVQATQYGWTQQGWRRVAGQ